MSLLLRPPTCKVFKCFCVLYYSLLYIDYQKYTLNALALFGTVVASLRSQSNEHESGRQPSRTRSVVDHRTSGTHAPKTRASKSPLFAIYILVVRSHPACHAPCSPVSPAPPQPTQPTRSPRMFTFVETGQHIFAVNENLSVVLCLYNMVLELKFTRFHDQPWGFRLSGGSDFAIPLTVIKVRMCIGDFSNRYAYCVLICWSATSGQRTVCSMGVCVCVCVRICVCVGCVMQCVRLGEHVARRRAQDLLTD